MNRHRRGRDAVYGRDLLRPVGRGAGRCRWGAGQRVECKATREGGRITDSALRLPRFGFVWQRVGNLGRGSDLNVGLAEVEK